MQIEHLLVKSYTAASQSRSVNNQIQEAKLGTVAQPDPGKGSCGLRVLSGGKISVNL